MMTTQPSEIEPTEVEKMKQARIRRLLKELNANSIQRSAIEEELRELGYEARKRGER